MRYNLNFIVAFIINILTIFFIVQSSLPHNVLSIDKKIASNIFTLFPQGWAFFTRDPREERYYLYEVEDEMLKNKILPYVSVSNLFGIKRIPRRLGIEFGTILTAVRNQRWIDCIDCHSFSSLPDTLVVLNNVLPTPLIKGDYMIVKQSPVPWAWSKKYKHNEGPGKILRVLVSTVDSNAAFQNSECE